MWFAFPRCQRLISAWHWAVAFVVGFFCFFFILKLFDSTVTMKWNNSFCISPFAWLYFPCFCCTYFIILALLFVCFFLICRGVLMSNQLSTPNFINKPGVTIWATICPLVVCAYFFFMLTLTEIDFYKESQRRTIWSCSLCSRGL